jgi:glycosyltransferase involved in cell wall biosynthesis
VNAELAVLEWCGSGHRLAYVAGIFDRAHSQTVTVSLYTTGRLGGEFRSQLRVHLAQALSAGLRIVDVPAFDQESFARRLRGMAWIMRQLSRDSVLAVPDGDRWLLPAVLLAPLARHRGIRLRLLIMHPFVDQPSWRARIRLLLKRSLTYLAQALHGKFSVGILIPSQGVARESLRIWPGVRLVGDTGFMVAERVDPIDARMRFSLPDDELVLGIFGVLSARKNPDLVLAAAELVGRELGTTVRVFAPGLVTSDLMGRLESRGTHSLVTLDLRNATLDAVDYPFAIRAASVVLVLHSNPGSSGVVTEAKALGVPVVASRAEGLRSQVESLAAGVCVELEAECVADAVLGLLASPYGPVQGDVETELVRPHSVVAQYLTGV